MTKRRRHTPEQVIRKLREGERLLGEGEDLAAVCKHLEALSRPGIGGATSTAG